MGMVMTGAVAPCPNSSTAGLVALSRCCESLCCESRASIADGVVALPDRADADADTDDAEDVPPNKPFNKRQPGNDDNDNGNGGLAEARICRKKQKFMNDVMHTMLKAGAEK